MGGSPFPYIIPIVPRSLPAEVIEGEHFFLIDLLKLVLGSSSQAISTQEGQTEATTRTLVRPAYVTQPQSPWPAPQPAKKRETRARQTKTVDARLEGFVDLTRIADSEPAEEEEKFSLTVGFVARMRKQSTTLEGEATSSSGEKQPRQSPSYEGAQKDWAIVSVESPYLASNDQPA